MKTKLRVTIALFLSTLTYQSVAKNQAYAIDDGYLAPLFSPIAFDFDSLDQPLEPVVIDDRDLGEVESDEEATRSSDRAPRVITYLVATQYANGVYQGSFDWSGIQHGLSFIGRYKDVVYKRVNSGANLRIVQANTQLMPNAAAWTNGNTIYISPVFNFGKNSALCKKVLVHENGHFIRGGTGHNADPRGIMSPNAGTAGNLIPSDYPWYAAYPWKSSLRPEYEPERMRQEFTGQVPPTD